MRSAPSRVAALLIAFAFLLSSVSMYAPGVASSDKPLTGFSLPASRAHREWERKFRTLIDAERLREAMQWMTRQPHHAGSPASREVAEYILGKFRDAGLEAEIEEFHALMPFPQERVVEMIEPRKFVATLREPAVTEDQDSTDAGQLPTFNAYSPDGDVTAQLVYVNYGRPSDYEQLKDLGVDVKGKIVIARYGESWRGIKPKVAWEHGAVGCLIYSDPRDDGFFQGDVYPEGPYRPDHGVQRGSVKDMPVYPGDPLTPGRPALKDADRLPREESPTIQKIPVLPISHADAEPLLRAMRGPVAPEAWRGALPLTYHIGPGPAVVRLKATFDWSLRPVYNVIARLPGSEAPDEWVIYGNHHDAWVAGAWDPVSASVVQLEIARALGNLLRQGWRPRRTIVLAAWDAEEWGLIGSTEWVEKHAAELSRKAVAYINSDNTAKGYLSMAGSHSLQKFINDVARDVDDPATRQNLREAARQHHLKQARTEEQRKVIRESADIRIPALGSGSDYTPFLQHLGIASLDIRFRGAPGAGIYHSIYDSFHWYARFGDPDFLYGRALAETIGATLLRLAGAERLPFEFTSLSETIGRYIAEIEELHKRAAPAKPENGDGGNKRASGATGTIGTSALALDFAPLHEGLRALEKSAAAYDAAASKSPQPGANRALNRALLAVERALTTEQGLPRRPWYRHQLYAPGYYTGYGVKTLPAVREAIEEKRWEEAQTQMGVVRDVLLAAARAIDRAAAQVTSEK